MPKDLTKLSLKEFDTIQGGDDRRYQWNNGTLELLIRQSGEDDDGFNED